MKPIDPYQLALIAVRICPDDPSSAIPRAYTLLQESALFLGEIEQEMRSEQRRSRMKDEDSVRRRKAAEDEFLKIADNKTPIEIIVALHKRVNQNCSEAQAKTKFRTYLKKKVVPSLANDLKMSPELAKEKAESLLEETYVNRSETVFCGASATNLAQSFLVHWKGPEGLDALAP